MFNLLLIQMHIKFLSFSNAICYNINYFYEMTRDIFVHSQEVYTQHCPDPPFYLNRDKPPCFDSGYHVKVKVTVTIFWLNYDLIVNLTEIPYR